MDKLSKLDKQIGTKGVAFISSLLAFIQLLTTWHALVSLAGGNFSLQEHCPLILEVTFLFQELRRLLSYLLDGDFFFFFFLLNKSSGDCEATFWMEIFIYIFWVDLVEFFNSQSFLPRAIVFLHTSISWTMIILVFHSLLMFGYSGFPSFLQLKQYKFVWSTSVYELGLHDPNICHPYGYEYIHALKCANLSLRYLWYLLGILV